MTLDQLIIKTVILQVLFIGVKVIFFGILNVNLLPIVIVYYVLLAAMSIAVVRRFGPLNYFEMFFVMIIWLIISLVADFVITSSFAGREIYSSANFWWSYAVVLLAMLMFFKKEHVEIRKGNLKK